jgi:hypothetical protein
MMTYKGNDWDASDGFPEDADPTYTPATGDYWECGAGGTIDGVVYRVGDIIVYTGSAWKKQGGSSGAPLSDNEPLMDSYNPSAGTGVEAARWDHKHPFPDANFIVTCNSAAGSGTRLLSFKRYTGALYTDLTITVRFKNDYYLDNSTDAVTIRAQSNLSDKMVYVSKDGQLIPMPTHLITRDGVTKYWAWQANTVLTLMFDNTLDDGHGGWIVIGNPVVLSGTSSTQSYTVKANGLTVQRYISIVSDFGRDYAFNLTYPIPITTVLDAQCICFSNSNGSLAINSMSSVNTTTQKIAGHCFGYNSNTPITRYGYTLTGY